MTKTRLYVIAALLACVLIAVLLKDPIIALHYYLGENLYMGSSLDRMAWGAAGSIIALNVFALYDVFAKGKKESVSDIYLYAVFWAVFSAVISAYAPVVTLSYGTAVAFVGSWFAMAVFAVVVCGLSYGLVRGLNVAFNALSSRD